MTPRTAAGGSWKNIATSSQEIAAGAAEAAVVPPWKGSQVGHSQQPQVRFILQRWHISTGRFCLHAICSFFFFRIALLQ